jgi:hypothetical protein
VILTITALCAAGVKNEKVEINNVKKVAKTTFFTGIAFLT